MLSKFSLKVMINKQKNKVLFAEADSHFADVLISFLTLPLGGIVKVLQNHYGDVAPVIGSLTTLYKGLANLGGSCFWTEGAKQMLLNPRSWFSEEAGKLKLDINNTQPIKYFSCEKPRCGHSASKNIGIYYGTARCECGRTLKSELRIWNVPQAADAKAGAFVINRATFVITDDLQIMYYSRESLMQIQSKLDITDTDWGELRTITFGFSEIMDLLKGSLLSPTPLTDVILGKGQSGSALPYFEPGILLHKIEEKESSSDSKKMVLKVIVQKSTNRFLFAESEEDFVDFLFSFLAVPLGGVECLLGCITCFKNIDNLGRSVKDIDGKYLKFRDMKEKLFEPKLAYGYLSKNRVLPLAEEIAPLVYYCDGLRCQYISLSYSEEVDWSIDQTEVSSFKSPIGAENYVMGPGLFMITDDLNVTNLSMALYVSTLNKLKIPSSDVTELVLHIGLEEALSIFKASLTSKSALSVGLMNSILMKQPKQAL